MTTVRELLTGADGIDKLDKQVWLGKIIGFSRAQLISRDDYCLSPQQLQEYHAGLARFKSGEPLAYLMGSKEFYSREFKVTQATLIPRPETELLVDTVLERARQCGQVLDLGTGSGCIAISLKLERPDLLVTAVDFSQEALIVASENAQRLSADVQFKLSDWFAVFTGDDQFAIIVSNPPYIEETDHHLADLAFEPLTALTDFSDGLECIRQIAGGAPRHLDTGGWLLVEHGYNQGLAVREIFAQFGLQNISTITDYAGIERITLGQKL